MYQNTNTIKTSFCRVLFLRFKQEKNLPWNNRERHNLLSAKASGMFPDKDTYEINMLVQNIQINVNKDMDKTYTMNIIKLIDSWFQPWYQSFK